MLETPQETFQARPGLFLVSAVPPLLWLALLFFLPLFLIWGYSFGEKRGLIDIEIVWTLQNYADALDPVYVKIFFRTLFYTALTTAICLIIGFPVALVVAFADERWKPFLLLLIVLPFWTNLLIRTFALMRILGRKGTINGILEKLHGSLDAALQFLGFAGLGTFQAVPMLFNHFGVVFGLVYVALPFMVLPLYAALERLDKSHLEASLDLGAGQIRTFLFVIVPMTATGIVSGLIITFIPTLGSFLTPDLLGGPDSAMIATIIARQFGDANHWPFGSAIAWLLVYVTFFLLALQAVFTARRESRLRQAGERATGQEHGAAA